MLKQEIIDLISKIPYPKGKIAVSIMDYADFAVRVKLKNSSIAKVWDDALAKAFSEHDAVYLPDTGEAYYISDSIVLHSGQQLRLDPGTVVRAMPDMNTVMVRNEHVLPGNQLPEPSSIPADHDICVSGGIWDFEREKYNRCKPSYDVQGSITGMHGLFSFSNIETLSLSNLDIRGSSCFSIQLSNGANIRISDVIFSNCLSDGIHMNGPLQNVWIKNVTSEGTNDDIISLNAWDWVDSHVTAGPMKNFLIENCTCNRGYSCIRMLAGIKRYFDETYRECSIQNVVFRTIKGVRNFKLYPQGFPERHYYSEVGKLENIYFDGISGLSKMNRISFDPPYYGQKDQAAPFEIFSNSKNIVLENLHGDFDFSEQPVVVAIGPISWTLEKYSTKEKSSLSTLELFPVDLNATVTSLTIGPVFGHNGKAADDPAALVKAFALSRKADFIPGVDTARGGTGGGQVKKIIPIMK